MNVVYFFGVIFFVVIAFIFIIINMQASGGGGYTGPCASVASEDRNECLADYYSHPTYDPASRYESQISTDQAQSTMDTQEQIWEYQETQSSVSSCPNGCASHTVGCDIKGNISLDAGDKIYHVPGQEYYEATTIDPAYGERWFCTEAEAIANGWRKAYK